MRARVFLLLVSLLAAGVSAQYLLQPELDTSRAPPALLGAWGNTAQCAAHRAGGNDDPRLFPYLISDDWIQHGVIFCQVEWQPPRGQPPDLSVEAFARCGEDGLREYRILLELSQGALRIRWSPDFTTAALGFCAEK